MCRLVRKPVGENITSVVDFTTYHVLYSPQKANRGNSLFFK